MVQSKELFLYKNTIGRDFFSLKRQRLEGMELNFENHEGCD